jgi:hypothetical protein
MSAAIVKKWFEENHKNPSFWNLGNIHATDLEYNEKGDNLSLLGWDYGDAIPNLSSYDKVIMVDVAFPAKEMKKIHLNLTGMKGYFGEGRKKQPSDFVWIDHHTSAIKEMEKEYPIGNSIPISLPFGFRDTKFAACELTWKYFYGDDPKSLKMPEIVRLLGMYDSFRHKGTDEEQKVLKFQYGARAHMSNYEECYNKLYHSLLDGACYVEVLTSILESGKAIYKYLCTEALQTYKKAFPVEFETGFLQSGKIKTLLVEYKKHKFLCVNQERFNPINFGIDYHKDGYDGFACFWLKDGKWNWSLYNDNGKVDCSVIAKQYNGGGHRGAAGMIIDTKTLLQIIT